MAKRSTQTKKNVSKKSDNPYSKGRRWGYAVAKASISAGGSNVHKADKAMRTCAQNARTGKKKLNQSERDAYRGMFDGMYDAFKQSERR